MPPVVVASLNSSLRLVMPRSSSGIVPLGAPFWMIRSHLAFGGPAETALCLDCPSSGSLVLVVCSFS